MHQFCRMILAVLTSVWLVSGCSSSPQREPKPIERMWEKPVSAAPEPVTPPVSGVARTTTAPASGPVATAAAPPRPEDVLAYVNGTPIMRNAVGDELIHTHGINLIQQMVLLIAARQRAQQMGLTVTPADIKAAHEEALKRIATPVGASGDLPLDRSEAERLLEEFLIAKNIAHSEWDRRMEQQAYLQKIATAELEKSSITEQMLREQYALEYGERVQIRHVQVSRLDLAERVRTQLAEHKEFERIAQQLSENPITASRGGLMVPFTRNDPSITPLLREAAFSLKLGEVSTAIHEGRWYHILRLERRFPASSVGFENVDRAVLTAKLKERLIGDRMKELEAEVFNKASVDIRDRELSAQFRRSRPAVQ